MKQIGRKLLFVLSLIIIFETRLFPNISLWFTPYIEIEGTVKIVGSSLFYDYVIDSENGERYYIDKSLVEDFKNHLSGTIKLSVKVQKKKIKLADKSKTFTRLIIVKYKDLR